MPEADPKWAEWDAESETENDAYSIGPEPRRIKHGTMSAYTRDRCRCDPCRAAASEYRRRYRAENPEKLKRRRPSVAKPIPMMNCQDCGVEMPASRNGFKKRCPSCKKAYRRERDNARNRRVRKARRLLDPEWAAKDRARVLERWRAKYDRLRASVREKSGGVCYLCAEPIDFSGPWHVDHVLARVRGGSDDLSNLKATHVDCNLSKGDMLVEDYLRRAALSLTG